MNSQDQRKNHTPGHENLGVHVCHKCGWSFPNPHPSAKHRRAHKKNCGKIEGFKLIDSEEKTHLSVSDEEQLSDEDHKSPGNSKLEEPRNNEQMKSGIRRQESNRLEEEVFSDAVAEFGDAGTSPAVETSVGTGAGEPDVNVEANERQLTLSVKASSGTNIVQVAEYPSHGTQIQGPQALESSVDNYESNILFQDHTSSSTIGPLVASLSYRETESLAVELMDDRCDSACFITPVEHEIPVNVFSENTNTKFGVNVMDGSLTNIGKDTDAQENKKSNIDGNFPPMAVSPSKPANVASEIDSKLREMNTDPVDRLVDSKEEEIDALGARPPQIDPSLFSAQVDSCNLKEKGYENKPALSTDMPAEGHSEMTVKDFKDHGPVTSDIYLTPVCGQVIKEMDDHPKNPASEEAHLGFLSCKPNEGADVSSAKQVLKENLQQEGTGSNSMTSDIYLPPGCVQVTKEMDDHPKNPASEEIHLGFQSCNSNEGGNVSSSAKQVLEENLQQDGTGSSSVVEEPVTSDIYLAPICAQVIKDMDDHPKNPASEEVHLGFLSCKPDEGADVSSAKQVLKENLQQEGTGSNGMTSDIYLPPGCVQVTKEMDDHPKIPASKEIHLDFQSCNSEESGDVSSSAKQVLEENLQKDGTGSNILVEEPVTSDIYQTPGCDQIIKDMDNHPKNPASEEVHSGFLSYKTDEGADVSSSAKQVLEENLQLEGTGSNSVIEEPVTSDIYLTPGCGQVIKEMDDHPKNASEEVHMGFLSCKSDEGTDLSSSSKLVLEENLQQEGTGSNGVVEEPVTSDIYLTPGCGQVLKEMDEHPKNASKELHSGFLSCKSDEGADVTSSVKQVLEENLQQEAGRKSMVEEVCIKHKTDLSDSKAGAGQVLEENLQQERTGSNSLVEEVCIKHKTDRYESKACAGNGSDGLEVFSDAISSNLALIHPEKSQAVCSIEKQESYDSHLVLSQVILPEKLAVSQAGGVAKTSPLDADIHEPNNAFSSGTDVPEKDRNGNSDIAGNYGEGAIEEDPTTNTRIAPEFAADVSKTELHVHAYNEIGESEGKLQESESTHLDTVVDSCLQNVTELHSDLQDCPDEDFQGSSKEHRVSSSIDSSVKKTEIQVDKVSEFLHEETKFDDNIVGSLQSGAENVMFNEHMPSATDIASCILTSVTVDNNSAKDICGDASDIKSQSLQDNGDNNLVKQQLGSSAVVLANVPVNSTGQIDCMERYPGSVSDGTVASTRDATDEAVIPAAETLQETDTQVLEKEAQEAEIKNSLGVNSSTKDFGGGASDISSQSLQDEGDNSLLNQQPDASAVVPRDISIDSNSQTDSVEGYWGSVSDGTLPSMRYTTEEPAILATQALQTSDTQGAKDEAQNSNLKNKIGASKEHCSDNSDMFEAPSFMTLVEPGKGNYRQAPSSEIQTVQNPQQPNSSSVQAGWFPSLTHVVNESQGRKKNEEIIAKVSNWSSGKPHTPLKSLLVEANLESKQKALNAQGRPALATNKDEVSAQDNGLPAKTLPLITAPKVSATRSAKGDAEREWNSPATLPDNKREGRKVRGKQYWVPFVCCASLNEDH